MRRALVGLTLLTVFVLGFVGARSGVRGRQLTTAQEPLQSLSFESRTSGSPLDSVYENPPVLDGFRLRHVKGKDGISAIDRPEFVAVRDAKIAPESRVMVVTLNGETHAYEVKLLARHEIVNDRIGGKPVLCSY